ncbi:glycerol-3-phosphate responsive antiterminator [Salirhabdus salicampi]|uniref:glycerol-3-phosphate responsive antiterminator n=1 Tax=Salirhabdus salicampi TaxID=476102 RepID=UPI0020C34232|nr:glycerol-3-phosphate responsive antiterminator [Salirhabdus salicampi]MCP8617635.1 glycerol-3-phosphate responsive antiterminator [Salirhabdus salicampi]
MSLPSGILPAVRNMKDFERLLASDHEYLIFLETRIAQLFDLVKYAKKSNKKVLIHTDLVQGLKADEHGLEYLIRKIKPEGVISTRGNIITAAKKHNIIAVQRLFLLDSHALEQNLKIINKVRPDYIEVLPGLMPGLIQEIYEKTNLPIITGGLIRSEVDVQCALDAGAVAVTTSTTDLWRLK